MKDLLIARLNAGSVSAFEKIMRKYTGYVFAVIRNYSHELLSREDIEELVSDTFVAVWKQRENIDPQRQLMPYLAIIARNKTANALRGLKLSVSLEDTDVRDSDLEAGLERKEAVNDILSAVELLSQKQKSVFTRFYFYGESLREISEGLRISSSDARTTLFRAREAVKKIISERGFEHDAQKHAVWQRKNVTE